MKNKNIFNEYGEFGRGFHDPVPGENRTNCSEISLFWGLIKIKG